MQIGPRILRYDMLKHRIYRIFSLGPRKRLAEFPYSGKHQISLTIKLKIESFKIRLIGFNIKAAVKQNKNKSCENNILVSINYQSSALKFWNLNVMFPSTHNIKNILQFQFNLQCLWTILLNEMYIKHLFLMFMKYTI